MASKRKVGAIITLDGEKEYRQAVTSCNKAMATMRSEIKLVEAQTAGQANKLETLTKKHDVLSRALDTAVTKEDAVRKGLEHAEDQYAKVGSELDDYKKKLEAAEKALSDMKSSGSANNKELEAQRKTVEDLSKAVESGEQTYIKAGNRVNDWKKQLNNAEAQTIRATKALNDNEALLKEAQGSFDKCATSIDKFGNSTANSISNLTKFGTVLKVNIRDGLIDLGKNAFTSAIQGALDLDEATNKLAASTGATASEMKEYSGVMQDTFNEGYADSVGEVADAMALVKQYTGETDPTKLQELTENAIALDDTFSNMDLSETLRGVDSLMKNMGLSAEEAFDYIVVGAQNGLNKSGELTDNIAEYGQLWAQAGFSAEEMFTILQNGLDNGAYNLDKVNDFVKEFGISLSDGRIEENLSSFSAETQNLFAAWKNGQASTKDVFYAVINDLGSMKNQQEALTIASNTWSALGEDNAMKVIASLTQVNSTYSNVKGSMESLKEVRYDSVTNEYKKLGRTMQTEVITPVLQKFLPAAKEGLEFLADNLDRIIPLATSFGAAMGAAWVTKKATKLIDTIKDTAKAIISTTTETVAQTAATTADTIATSANTVAKGAQAVATEGATVAQEGLNKSMLANPYTALAMGIAGLVAGFVTYVATSPKVKSETEQIGEAADEAIASLQESQEALQSSMDSAQESVDSALAKGQMAGGIVDELKALSASTDESNDKQSRMAVLVAELNELYPDMALAIDEATGKLNMTNQELDDYVDNLQDAAMASAYQEAFEEAFKGVADASRELIDAEMEQEKVKERLNAIDDERIRAQELMTKANEENGSGIIEWNGIARDAVDVLSELNDEETYLEGRQEELTKTIGEQNKVVDEGTEKAEAYKNKQLELTGAIESETEATQNSTDAKGKQAEAAQASISVAGQELEAFRNLSTEQQTLAVNVTNTVLAMQGSVQEYLGQTGQLFQQFADTSTISTTQLLTNMQSQVDGVKTWESNMVSLMDETKSYIDETGQEVQVKLDTGLVQYLMNLGPEGAAYAQTFVNMTGEEMAKANELWSEKTNIEGFTNEEGQKLTQGVGVMAAGGVEALNSLGEALNSQAKTAGGYTVSGLVAGITEAQSQATAAGEDLGVNLIDSMDSGLGVASPSWKAKSSGLYVTTGLIQGINEGSRSVRAATEGLGFVVINTLSNKLQYSVFSGIGYNVAAGLAGGIYNGESAVITAATHIASAAINAANSKLEINSPSHVFQRIGAGTIEGFVKGIDDNAKDAQKSVSDALQFDVSRSAVISAGLNISSISADDANINYSYMHNIVYSAIAAGLRENNPNSELLKIISDMAKRPVQSSMYIGKRKIAEAISSDVSTVQQRNTRIKNMVKGVKA